MASIFSVNSYLLFISLYATIVCVAGSQLEQLRATLVDIRETHGTSLQNRGRETDEPEAAAQKNTPSEQFRHMQEQLNNCIRHHQEIKR
jgi:signal transduction histidine kinase